LYVIAFFRRGPLLTTFDFSYFSSPTGRMSSPSFAVAPCWFIAHFFPVSAAIFQVHTTCAR
jgi:hypothetical protein